MKITGYSERGAVNALFYELAYSGEALSQVEKFLSLVECPEFKKFFKDMNDAHVLIEQSLSDFGDADVIFLLDTSKAKTVVFLEVKVKTFQRETWSIKREFKNFKEGCGTIGKLSSSNLFTQLYHKSRLIDALKSPRIGIKGLQEGIEFPKCSTKRLRKIGNNRVVVSVAQAIELYCENAWYFSLVPDKLESIRCFYDQLSPSVWPQELGVPDFSRWGGITWEEVAEFCGSLNLKSTIRVLEFNKGQIY